ncbi:MAG TPA: hypothetical protein VM759_12915 [Longimicrobium sp.]|nr:hypothetical protein [Longimicrobium sp.]
MSKTIKVSDEDFVRIRNAAAAEGMPPEAWILEHLPLERTPGNATALPPSPDGQRAKTMYDLFAGRVGRFNSGTGQPGSDEVGNSLANHLEEKHREGRL